MPKEAKEPTKPVITFGPFEQALVVLMIMTFGGFSSLTGFLVSV